MTKKLFCLLTFLTITFFFSANGQQTDSTLTSKTQQPKIKEKKNQETLVKKKHSPHKATVMSTIVPGLGQVYNRKYWKPVIIYGIGGWFVYNISTSNSEYQKFLTALNDRQEKQNCIDCTEEQTALDDDFVGVFSDSQLKTRKDFYKKQRDNNILYLLLLYGANIVDAAVDAHLINFNVGEEYIMSLEPTFIQTASVSNTFGLSLTLNYK